MTQVAPIRERFGVGGRVPGHGLTVVRADANLYGTDVVLYEGACSCGRWSDSSRFRKLVTDAYVRHLADSVLDRAGDHDQLRATLRALRGPLAPSVEGDPK
jgi:hypothetical protein